MFFPLPFRSAQKKGGLGMFSALRNLVGSKTLTKEDLKPMMDKMKDHLIGTKTKQIVFSVCI